MSECDLGRLNMPPWANTEKATPPSTPQKVLRGLATVLKQVSGISGVESYWRIFKKTMDIQLQEDARDYVRLEGLYEDIFNPQRKNDCIDMLPFYRRLWDEDRLKELILDEDLLGHVKALNRSVRESNPGFNPYAKAPDPSAIILEEW